jgi:hypothetical protein
LNDLGEEEQTFVDVFALIYPFLNPAIILISYVAHLVNIAIILRLSHMLVFHPRIVTGEFFRTSQIYEVKR